VATLPDPLSNILKGNGGPIDGKDLLVWQETVRVASFHTTVQVPDLIYKIKRGTNERAMKSAASQLGRQARKSGQ
jgi:hypothetical protein